jgi:hypothetical protein
MRREREGNVILAGPYPQYRYSIILVSIIFESKRELLLILSIGLLLF